MSQVLNVFYDVAETINTLVNGLPEVTASKLGLDIRAGYCLWVDEDAIIVSKHNDRLLQYYGGFEYVEASARTECGDWVIYTNDSERVADCLEHYYEEQAEQDA